MQKARYRDQAVLRTLADKSRQNYATRRLIHDLKEIENCEIPTVGVTARPLQSSLFIWHANLRGPDGTAYEGGVFHLELNFPLNYPHDPPTIKLFNELPHPNVFGTELCLDMLNASNRGIYHGWTSAYSVLSILIQLQSFLFEEPDDKQQKQSIRAAVRKSQEFSCTEPECRHKGSISIWPTFHNKEKDSQSFQMVKSPRQLLEEELFCYHSRISYKESPLGIGLSISRVPRTGMIRAVQPELDFICLKAFMKEGLRKSSENLKFTHWLPLYFGTGAEERSKTLHLLKKSLSMICTGSTRKFQEDHILKVLPKLISTLVYEMMDDKRHTSLKAFRMLTYVHRLYVLTLEEFPAIKQSIDQSMNDFKNDESKRIKDVTPALGNILANLSVWEAGTWEDIKEALISEQFDREVFWKLRDVPELIEQKQEVNEEVVEVYFKASLTSHYITMFFALWSMKYAMPKGSTLKQIAQKYDENLSRMKTEEEGLMQKEINEIKLVKSFSQYFPKIYLPTPDNKTLVGMLQQAIINSKKKKYHGTDDELLSLPNIDQQIKTYQAQYPNFMEALKTTDIKDDAAWKNMCLMRWKWIKSLHDQQDQEWTVSDIAKVSNKWLQGQQEGQDEIEDLLQQKNSKLFTDQQIQQSLSETAFENHKLFTSWAQIYAKLDFEQFMLKFSQNSDFKLMYTYLDALKNVLEFVIIPIIDIKDIKSNYHYITSILTRFPQLKAVQFMPALGFQLNKQGVMSLWKGFINNSQAQGQILQINLQNSGLFNSISSQEQIDLFYRMIMVNTQLRLLNLEQNSITSQNLAKCIGKILVDHKNLTELNISNCSMNQSTAKEIADGLMRAKSLEILNVSKNRIENGGLFSILYNLAFSSRIRIINASQISGISNNQDLKDALYKLINITNSLEVLSLSGTDGIAQMLGYEFGVALGQNQSLRVLDISNTGNIGSSNAVHLGYAIGFNAWLGGQLQIFNVCGTIQNFAQFNDLYQHMWLSNYDKEKVYGEASKANKMTGEDTIKYFKCKLKQFIFMGNNMHDPYALVKHAVTIKEPIMVSFLTQNLEFNEINLSNCSLVKRDIDYLCRALNPKEGPSTQTNLQKLNLSKNKFGRDSAKLLSAGLEFNTNLIHLDISGNNIGVSGAKAIANMIRLNNTLQTLNLFSNKLDVDGARALGQALVVNKSIYFLDIGSNRIRDKGIQAISEGIKANQNTSLQNLAIRWNFISDDGLQVFLQNILENKALKLKQLFCKSNNLTEPGLDQFQKLLQQKAHLLYVDAFQKFQYLQNETMEKSIWISPSYSFNQKQIANFFEQTHKCGTVIACRNRKGLKQSNKPEQNNFIFVEFGHINSVARALHLASKKKTEIGGQRFRIYKAGTSTRIFLDKATAKSKEQAARGQRTQGRGRGRGRPVQSESAPRARGGRRGRGRGAR